MGLSGKDGTLVHAKKLKIVYQEADKPPEIIDPGLVGEVTHINPEIIHTLTGKGFIPIIAPVGVGEAGETYNINADLVASRMAGALSAGRLVLITDVDGLMDKDGELIPTVDKQKAGAMIEEQSITGGMIPKVTCALEALESGIEKVQLINGKRRHALLLELFTDKGIGTEVVA